MAYIISPQVRRGIKIPRSIVESEGNVGLFFLRAPPTYLQPKLILIVEDYGLEASIRNTSKQKAGPFLIPPCSLRIESEFAFLGASSPPHPLGLQIRLCVHPDIILKSSFPGEHPFTISADVVFDFGHDYSFTKVHPFDPMHLLNSLCLCLELPPGIRTPWTHLIGSSGAAILASLVHS